MFVGRLGTLFFAHPLLLIAAAQFPQPSIYLHRCSGGTSPFIYFAVYAFRHIFMLHKRRQGKYRMQRRRQRSKKTFRAQCSYYPNSVHCDTWSRRVAATAVITINMLWMSPPFFFFCFLLCLLISVWNIGWGSKVWASTWLRRSSRVLILNAGMKDLRSS